MSSSNSIDASPTGKLAQAPLSPAVSLRGVGCPLAVCGGGGGDDACERGSVTSAVTHGPAKTIQGHIDNITLASIMAGAQYAPKLRWADDFRQEEQGGPIH